MRYDQDLVGYRGEPGPTSTTLMYLPTGKRLLDLTVAILGLAVLSPIMLVVAALVRARMGSPVLFCQARPGLHGRAFTMLKFRTMLDVRDSDGQLLPDGERLTALGRILRSTSLDELPELVNVVRGDMSLVGPRPLLMAYLERYRPEQMRRHEVKPGITGWAQINGRNTVSWTEKFRYDLWYVEHQSFQLDCKVLWKTLKLVATRHGINQPGHATAEEFRGEIS